MLSKNVRPTSSIPREVNMRVAPERFTAKLVWSEEGGPLTTRGYTTSN